jgi:predicted MarR family transcription regulator
MTTRPRREPSAGGDLDRHWHLACNAHEIAVTDLEYSLFRVSEAFLRWQAECFMASSSTTLSGADNGVLHVIRMKERPKGVTEIARLLNRDDIANVQYSIRKLSSAGLIERGVGASPRNVTYQVTATGHEVTERYAALRRRLLIELTRSVADSDQHFEEATRLLNLMTGIYDQAARDVATHRRPTKDA